MELNAYVILEFSDVCQPLLICSLSGAPVTGILDRGLDSFFAADPEHTFIVYLDSVVALQIIPYSAVTHIGTGHVDFFNLFSDPLIFDFISRDASVKPFVVGCTAYMPQLAKRPDRITMFFVFLFDRLIDLSVPDQAQPRLLSSSSSFFRKDASISACSFSARRILFSARSCSSSDISSNGFDLPRLS